MTANASSKRPYPDPNLNPNAKPCQALNTLIAHPAGAKLLAAISLGAVFMGANTYLGNGPNLMVQAIAQVGFGIIALRVLCSHSFLAHVK